MTMYVTSVPYINRIAYLGVSLRGIVTSTSFFLSFLFYILGERAVCYRKFVFNPEVYRSGKEGRPQVNVHSCGVYYATHLGNDPILPLDGLLASLLPCWSKTSPKMAYHTSSKTILLTQNKFSVMPNS